MFGNWFLQGKKILNSLLIHACCKIIVHANYNLSCLNLKTFYSLKKRFKWYNATGRFMEALQPIRVLYTTVWQKFLPPAQHQLAAPATTLPIAQDQRLSRITTVPAGSSCLPSQQLPIEKSWTSMWNEACKHTRFLTIDNSLSHTHNGQTWTWWEMISPIIASRGQC